MNDLLQSETVTLSVHTTFELTSIEAAVPTLPQVEPGTKPDTKPGKPAVPTEPPYQPGEPKPRPSTPTEPVILPSCKN
jgi:hypothetical protein